MKKWRCTVCGYIHTGEKPPEVCQVCGAGSEFLEELVLEVLVDTPKESKATGTQFQMQYRKRKQELWS
jgi:hypothetical protein